MKTRSNAPHSDRKEELKALLSLRDITPEHFLKVALAQQEIERIDIFRFIGAKGWESSKVDTINVGFEPTQIEEYIASKFGPGRYRFSPVAWGEFLTHKIWSFGQILDSEGNGFGGPIAREEDDNDIIRGVAKTLKERSAIATMQSAVADQERSAMETAMAPAKMAMDMMATMKEALLKPAPDNGMGQMMSAMMTTMMTLVTTMITQGAADRAESTRMMLTFMDKSQKAASEPGGLARVVEAITMLEGKLGESLADAISGRGDKGIDWAAAVQAAAPVLERTLGLIERRAMMPAPGAPPLRRPARPTVLEHEAQPAPTTDPSPAPTEAPMPMRLHEDEDVNATLHEAAALAVQMLKSRDFKSLERLLATSFPEFLQMIDFDTNPSIYLLMLQKANPAFGPLRAEFIDFFKYLEQLSEEEPEPGAAVTPAPERVSEQP